MERENGVEIVHTAVAGYVWTKKAAFQLSLLLLVMCGEESSVEILSSVRRSVTRFFGLLGATIAVYTALFSSLLDEIETARGSEKSPSKTL